jgi:hypothetical protein
MDKSFAWNTLARGLREAAVNHNWEAVARLDGQIANLLRSLGSLPALSTAERMALDELRDAHQAAADACAKEIDVVGRQLDEMRSRQDGWRAYAVNGDLEELNP